MTQSWIDEVTQSDVPLSESQNFGSPASGTVTEDQKMMQVFESNDGAWGRQKCHDKAHGVPVLAAHSVLSRSVWINNDAAILVKRETTVETGDIQEGYPGG